MISSETSANATSSARRMSGGCSSGLAGTGAPSWLLEDWFVEGLRSPGGDLFDERSLGNGLPGNSLPGKSLLGAPRTMLLAAQSGTAAKPLANQTLAAQRRSREQRFHRGIVSTCLLDSARRNRAAVRNCEARAAFVGAEHHTMRIQRGSPMTHSGALSSPVFLVHKQTRFSLPALAARTIGIFERGERASTWSSTGLCLRLSRMRFQPMK